MRGYLVSIESAAENEFIKDAVMCGNSTDAQVVLMLHLFMLQQEKLEQIIMDKIRWF